MSKSAYENALSRKKEIEAELVEIEKFLSLYQRFESKNNTTSQPVKSLESGTKYPENANVAQRRKTSKKIKPSVLMDLTAKVLKEAGRPLSRREIILAIEALGYTPPGQDKMANLGSTLHRFKEKISSREGGGYWFTGYEPPNHP